MKLKKEIFAAYDKKYIRIYQAYNKQIYIVSGIPIEIYMVML